MLKDIQNRIGIVFMIAAASAGCYSAEIDEASEDGAPILAEVQVSAGKRLVFVDEGEGRVGVAEISSMAEAPVVTPLIQNERATPLEIFLATARDGEEIPPLLLENHRVMAAEEGREDPEPRAPATLRAALEALSFASSHSGTTPCNAAGWEGPSGAWGNPVDSWDQQFTNTTSVYSGNTSYPRIKSITQQPAWNGGSGSYHTHGACIANDTGADDKIMFGVFLQFFLVFSTELDELPGDNEYVTYTQYVSTNGQSTTSRITNAGSASASFRHSAAAWVPFPQ